MTGVCVAAHHPQSRPYEEAGSLGLGVQQSQRPHPGNQRGDYFVASGEAPEGNVLAHLQLVD
jgi:hypothetical protein